MATGLGLIAVSIYWHETIALVRYAPIRAILQAE